MCTNAIFSDRLTRSPISSYLNDETKLFKSGNVGVTTYIGQSITTQNAQSSDGMRVCEMFYNNCVENEIPFPEKPRDIDHYQCHKNVKIVVMARSALKKTKYFDLQSSWYICNNMSDYKTDSSDDGVVFVTYSYRY